MAAVGYRGKVVEREEARLLRAEGWTMPDIALKLGVSRSSVSLWTRDVPFTAGPRRFVRPRQPNALERRKAGEIAEMLEEGRQRIGQLSDRDLLVAGTALYAGEGAKTDRQVLFANSDPRMIVGFMTWLRRCIGVEQSRLRVRLYLHEGLDLATATQYWSDLTGIPIHQFEAPYRAVPDPSIRTAKHVFGCASVRYSCSRTHRRIMGLVHALLGSEALSGVAQLAERRPVKPFVVGSSPTPGADARPYLSLGP